LLDKFVEQINGTHTIQGVQQVKEVQQMVIEEHERRALDAKKRMVMASEMFAFTLLDKRLRLGVGTV